MRSGFKIFGAVLFSAIIAFGIFLSQRHYQIIKATDAHCYNVDLSQCTFQQNPTHCWRATSNNQCRRLDGTIDNTLEIFSGPWAWDAVVCYTCSANSLDSGLVKCSPGNLVERNGACAQATPGPTPPPPPPPPGPTPTPPPPPPYCGVGLVVYPSNVVKTGQKLDLIAGNYAGNLYTYCDVYFTSSNPVAYTSGSCRNQSPCYGELIPVSPGNTNVTATCSVVGPGGSSSSTATTNVTVQGSAWWQVKDGDVLSRASLYSMIPQSCLNNYPSCNPFFDTRGKGAFPGLPVYGEGGDYDFSDQLNNKGLPAETQGWIAQSNYSSSLDTYTYKKLVSQIPSDVTFNDVPFGNITQAVIDNPLAVPTRGYTWFKVPPGYSAAVIENIVISGDKKVIILSAEGQEILIQGNVTIQTLGRGFFMMLAGKSSSGFAGDTIVFPNVTSMDGMYFTEGIFSVNAPLPQDRNNNQFVLRGAVVTNQAALGRDLGDARNAVNPAERFEYAPEITVLFPREFMRDRVNWKEIAP